MSPQPTPRYAHDHDYDYGFRVGDRVRIVSATQSDLDNDLDVGATGTVCVIDPPDDQPCIGVAWDNFTGHHCRGHAPARNGWYVFPDSIEHIPSLRVWAGRAIEEDEFTTP